MAHIALSVNNMRNRFILLTFGMNLECLSLDIGVHSNTLYRFRRGGIVSLPVLDKIETWCDAQQKDTPHA